MKYDYTIDDIEKAFRLVGIEDGDEVFIHSNLGFYGLLEGGANSEDVCEKFLKAIQNVIGESGTVVVPTFSYSYCHGEIFNPKTTKTTCGMLANYMIKNYPENRTLDPNFSVCGKGKNIDKYKTCNIHESFGTNSFWEMFMHNNGKIVCMNFDAGSTFIHYIEQVNSVEYRYNKAFNGVTEVAGRLYKDYAVHYVFDKEENAPCMERVDQLCRENGLVKQTNLGKGTLLSFSTKEYFSFFSHLLKKRPRVLCAMENQ